MRPDDVGGPLDDVNEGFHDAYDTAKKGASHDAPTFVVLADSLILFRRGERRETVFSPPLFHWIKSVAHAPIAVFSETHRHIDKALDAPTIERLERLRARIDAARNAAEERSIEPAIADNAKAILDRAVAFADRVIATKSVDRARFDAFARELGPLLLKSTEHATDLELNALDIHVKSILASLSAEERATFHVVVTGDHQARVRSLGMQYFAKLLGEREGEELRVTYAEGVTDEKEALALIGTRRLDRAIAAAFFGDPARLQRDVLGDAVHKQLESRVMPKLD